MNNFNLIPIINLIFLYENAGMEFNINDGVIVDDNKKKTAQQGNELNCPNS